MFHGIRSLCASKNARIKFLYTSAAVARHSNETKFQILISLASLWLKPGSSLITAALLKHSQINELKLTAGSAADL